MDMELMIRLAELKIPENDSSPIFAYIIVLLSEFSNKSARVNRFHPQSEISI